MFRGQAADGPDGAPGDWALLNQLMVDSAYQSAILLEAGTIRADSLQRIPSGTVLIGSPGTVIVQTLPDDGSPLTAAFAASSGDVLSVTTLAADAAKGATEITTSAALSVGDLVEVVNSGSSGNSPGLRASIHTVQSISGATSTLDRPLPRGHQAGDLVMRLASVPQDILIDGQGMLLTGTGVRFLELAAARRCVVKNLNVDASQGMPSDLLMSFDIGSHDCTFENIRILGDGTPLVGLALESADSSRIRDVFVQHCRNGVVLYDSAFCMVDDAAIDACERGLLLTSDTGVNDISTRGCNDCTVSAVSTQGGSIGCQLQFGTEDCVLIHLTCTGASSTGIVVGGDASLCHYNQFLSAKANHNSMGLWIAQGAKGTTIQGLNFSDNGSTDTTGVGVVIDDDSSLTNLFSSSGNNETLLLARGGVVSIDGLQAVSDPAVPINTVVFYGATRVSLSNVDLKIGRVCNGINTLEDLSISNVRVAPLHPEVTAVGLVVTRGTTRSLFNCNFDMCGQPTLLLGGRLNFGAIDLHGATRADVEWPDLRSTDVVSITSTQAQGAVSVVQTPGLGFRVDAVGDPGIVQWRVNGLPQAP